MSRLRRSTVRTGAALLLVAVAILAARLLPWPASVPDGPAGTPASQPRAEAAALFPTSYEASRAAFRAACERELLARAGRCGSVRIASPSGTDLTIDTASFSQGGRDLLVVQSGIHGPEGYAGAAIQQLLLSRHLAPLLGRGVDVYLIHALNPYGFAQTRRADEANVNLNRNFSADDALYRRHNPDYALLRDVFEPAGPVGRLWVAKLATYAALLWAFAANGFDSTPIDDAMNTGQYEFPNGLNYGGGTHRPQTAFMISELAPLLRSHDGRILFLDLHTGLGASGTLHLLTGKHPAPAMLAHAREMFDGLQSEGITLASTDEAGFYPTAGDVIDFVPSLATDPTKVLALTMEFATGGNGISAQLRDATRMILENQAHFNGCGRKDVCDAIQADFRELFDPDDPAWREAVLRKADLVIRKIAEEH